MIIERVKAARGVDLVALHPTPATTSFPANLGLGIAPCPQSSDRSHVALSRADTTLALTRQQTLLVGLVNWYNANGPERIHPLIQLTSPRAVKGREKRASLRRLDHIVRTELTRMRQHELYDDYKSQIKSFRRKLFDPFCRADILTLVIRRHDGGAPRRVRVRTCVAQMNFVRWVLERGVIDCNSRISDEYFASQEPPNASSLQNPEKK
jgi:hypothetical protein